MTYSYHTGVTMTEEKSISALTAEFGALRRCVAYMERSKQMPSRRAPRLERLLNAERLGVYFTDRSNTIGFANNALLRMVGYGSHDLPISLSQLTPSECRSQNAEIWEQLRTTGSMAPWRQELIHRDGRRIPVVVGGTMLEGAEEQSVCFVVELTGGDAGTRVDDNRTAGRQAPDLAIGHLAGGFAHELRNLLQIIMSSCERLLRYERPDGNHVRDRLQQILAAGVQGATLITKLLTLTTHPELKAVPTNLNRVVREAARVLDTVIGEKITVVAKQNDSLRCVKADPIQMEQIIWNLVLNAKDAMPFGGTLTIETANVRLSKPRRTMRGSVPEGSYVRLRVRDTGTGISAEILDRIFEPCFTTKDSSEGMGLGLSNVCSIVEYCGGYLDINSQASVGTTVDIYFPPVVQPEAQKTSAGKRVRRECAM